MLKSEWQLEAEMWVLPCRAELIDAPEDRQYGKGKLGNSLPEKLRRRSREREAVEAEPSGAELSSQRE